MTAYEGEPIIGSVNPHSHKAPSALACTRCGFDLGSTPPQNGWLTCPECGLGQKLEQPQGPLNAEHLAQIDLARKRGKKLRKAAGVAKFSAWTTGMFAATALLGGAGGLLLGGGVDKPALSLGVVMSVVTMNEFRGGTMLRRADRRGPGLLCFNQLFLMVAIAGYCVWNMFFVPSSFSTSSGSPEVDQMLGKYSGIETSMKFAFYGAVILGSVLAQGLTALYYISRRRVVTDYLAQTPEWVIELDRRAA